MSTVSTKSRDRKTATDRNAAPSASDASTDKVDALEISPRIWRLSSLTILLGAAFIRLYQLGLVPMHHDEGVNGFFLTSLYRTGVYHYDPTNYHGPTLYYFALVVTKLNALLFGSTAGLSTIAVRLVPAIFGIGTVWLALCLRRNIGTIGALAAAAFIALSPGDVYISRYFIHETHFVFFTLGIVVAALRYYESADPIYLLLASTSAALLFATKETATVNVAVIGLALAVAAVYRRLFKRKKIVPWEKKKGAKQGKSKKRSTTQVKRPNTSARYRYFSKHWQQFSHFVANKAKQWWHLFDTALARFGGISNVAFWSSIAFALFIFINILFYSSFFTYGQGVSGALESLQVWVKTGTNDPSHVHPLSTYLIWLWQVQAPLLLLGAVGALIALIRRRNRFTIFAGAWAFGIIAAYSLIPYKTPWLMINFTVPLAIIGGYAINEIYNFEDGLRPRILALTLAATALVVSGTQSVILNFYHYDDDQYPYVYAHSYRDLLSMVNEIERLAKRAGTEMKTPITITASEYWPLPWYLRDYEGAAFFGSLFDSNGHLLDLNSPVVVSSEKQEVEQSAELQTALGDRYQRLDSYRLRPGVTLVLYAKKELAAP
ncbi:MAG: hypothetical protein QOC96_1596 [Acidobacteriota bacterium]|nr:hypothetical protein [Acidobacteriota bacterium]